MEPQVFLGLVFVNCKKKIRHLHMNNGKVFKQLIQKKKCDRSLEKTKRKKGKGI